MNSRVLAIALAAVLVLAAVPLGASVWADDGKERKAKDKIAIKENKQARFDDDDERTSASLGSLKATGKGVAVVKSPGSVKSSDATVDLSGTVLKDAGKNARVSVNGTVTYGGEQLKVTAAGKAKVDRSDVGKLQLHGKISKDGERDQPFSLNTILLPTQDDSKWKMIGEQPVVIGRQVRLYALMGELQLDRTTPQPTPQPMPGNLDHFVISQLSSQVAGTEFTFTVTAVDDDGKVKTDYTGTVTVSSNAGTSPNGNAPVFTPASYTFTLQDAGKKVFSAKLYDAENSVTVTVAGSGKTVTSNAFEVRPAALSSVAISPASATVNAGASATFAATAKDAYGNAIAGANYVWALGTPSLGTLAVLSNTASVLFTAASVSAVSSSALSVTATHGGASTSSSMTVTVSPV